MQYIDINSNPGEANSPMVFAQIQAAAGTVTLQTPPPLIGLVKRGNAEGSSVNPRKVEIVVTQQAADVQLQPFTAPGLTLGGEQTWKYVWDFRGLSSQ